jgi:16S rRNA (cytosine1402-N4)-methyltransferase
LFHQKYKELTPAQHPDLIQKLIARGKTPAGQHLPIMVEEIIQCLGPQPGHFLLDATLGHGGHATRLIPLILPGGQFLGIDQDPIELPQTTQRLQQTFAPELGNHTLTLHSFHGSYAALPKAINQAGWDHGPDLILADLGLSSMQIDNPARGFSFKTNGPLDMRMNPQRGQSAAAWLKATHEEELTHILSDFGDEPFAAHLAPRILAAARKTPIQTTKQLSQIILANLPQSLPPEEKNLCQRRCFQAIRIHINQEFAMLEAFLRSVPHVLRPGGRLAVLSFHSGEDRRVKHALQDGLQTGHYQSISPGIIRPSPAEQGSNPRSTSAKLRWAIKA